MSTMNYEQLKEIMLSGYANLENNKQSVNDLNVFPVPDGDTGTNMSLTMQYAVNEVKSSNARTVGEIATASSSGALMGARGNSGVILSQLLRGFSKSLMGKEIMSVSDAASALSAASDMAYKAVMKPTEGTILTVARIMAEFAVSNSSKYTSGRAFLNDVIENGHKALDTTPDLLPVLKEAGVVDAGGRGLLYILEGALSAMNGQPVMLDEKNAADTTAQFNMEVNSDIKFAYCTEFLISTNGKEKQRNALIDKLIKLGDSLLVIEDGSIIKVHVHTNEPWTAMKIAAGCGELNKIKIENMKQQHNELFEGELSDEAFQEEQTEYSDEEMQYVIVSVSSGEGLSAILKDLGVTYIISGGQTMNPSTEDFLKVINNTNGKNYILLPNNKNIILAAKQAEEISDKNVAVLETRTIPEAISALMEFNPANTLEANIDNMREGAGNVKTGQVTFAVRDSSVGGINVKCNDIIGIIGSDIICAESDVESAVKMLADKLIDDNVELITLYYGQDISEDNANALKIKLSGKYPDIQFESFNGGQPLYYYIISAE